jgi:1,4-dihydroxy-6-naphthoate synthase
MLTAAYSPCPNDTFIFHGWASGKTSPHVPIQPILADVQELNRLALLRAHPVTKVSFFCLGQILEDYVMLPSGAALGHACGPKIIAREKYSLRDLSNLRIAIPGQNTTAHLLLQLLCPTPKEKIFCLYNEINPLLNQNSVDCGLIIHESRFTFAQQGFHEIADLGMLWEQTYRCPIPLGCIAAKRDLGEPLLTAISKSIQQSLSYAWKHPMDSREYILQHSNEKDPKVIQDHIRLYVNEETSSLSSNGIKAINTLFHEARGLKLIPSSKKEWLFSF